MAKYDSVPTTEDDLLDLHPHLWDQQQQRVPTASSSSSFLRRTSHFLPDLTNAIRARASSIVSDISFHGNRSGSHSDTLSPPLLAQTHSSSSGSPTSPAVSSSPRIQDTQTLHRSSISDSLRSANSDAGNANSTGISSNKAQRAISHQSPHVRLLRLIWLVALMVGEHGTYWAMVRRCSWPENSLWDSSKSALKDRYRIAVVADPQLTDWMSYHQSGLLLALVETYTDIYMKRSFRRLHASLRPDAVLFLGDLNDGGRLTHGETFNKNLNRFQEWIFETKSTAWNQQPIVMDVIDGDSPVETAPDSTDDTQDTITGHYRQLVNVPLDADEREAIRNAGRSVRLYVAGNHDVGFGDTLIPSSLARFKRVWGSVNYEINVGNHSLVVLDTLALSSDIKDIREESQQFLTQMEREQLIIDRKGEQFQNMVNATLSRQILRGIQPDMVFSGDDHDWCEIAHSLDGTLTPEVTLPTFSFAQGIQQPGFVMLSLYNPDHKVKNNFPMVPVSSGLPTSTDEGAGSVARPTDDTTFAYDECMLPNQILIYMCYVALLGFTVNWILAQRYRWMMRGRRHLAERSILVRWTDSLSGPSNIDMVSHGSAAAVATSQRSQQGRLTDDDSFEGFSPTIYADQEQEQAFFNGNVSRKGNHVWPLLSTIYWKMAGWDIWNIARYVVPFYAFLFVVSII
ncbi:hypothetical protein BGZ99_000010 [Dissophora globulifera]|uniref:Calcineurin-like phosphoesterase domain-containing protein n=1 Tax=Dissophora globulifera TaxID=979702 RepID=A0A9P6RUW4_9FUNG|nr:hypothetical protein BGZ99_000010 [Dissophora globulifera]